MKNTNLDGKFRIYAALVVALLFLFMPGRLHAQGTATITGLILDPRGNIVPNAVVVITNESSGQRQNVTADAQGHFAANDLTDGKYMVLATAPGFAPTVQHGLVLASGQSRDISLSLSVGNVSEQVTVEADASNSLASQHAPMESLLSARSARTEINQTYIQNFTSPIADYGEITQMVPGTFTTNANGVGLGQSTTSFRGFPDGDYDIDFDGIPFYDTNTPSHHSWAFFPSQWIGGIDFDRSPGTASTIGPTPFGGSIHLLSKDLPAQQHVSGGVSYGSFHTYLYDAEYNSGAFGDDAKKSNLFVDVHHMQSDGYQTLNFQTRNAGSLKYQYQLSSKTVLTGFSGVIWLDANTPNLSSTRQQLLTFGNNYLLQNTDTTQANYYRYNTYHVPTDFEYVGIYSDLGHGWRMDVKPYTYNYDNSEFYSKQPKSGPINQTNCQPVPTKVTEAGVTLTIPISPCAVDKYNSYRKYGETSAISQTSRFGVFRAGLWYEWARTNRHQTPSNPFTLADDPSPNFSEKYFTNSYQPYSEYEWHATLKLSITAGLKFAFYTMDFTQLADNGGKIGSINPVTGKSFTSVTNDVHYHSWLPSLDANYRLKTNWSIYGQASTGSVVPPTSVFDVAGAVVAVPPKPQTSTTYQTGTILKLRRISFDADYYHIRFQNGYSSATDTNPNDAQFGESINFISPSSVTQGGEFESTIYLGSGLSIYLNATRGRATYVGTLTANSPAGSNSNPLKVKAPSGLWVAGTPTDTESEGVTYQRRSWDLGFFNKRVGSQWEDNGAYHNQQRVDPFSVANGYINYTIRNDSRFDQTKIRLSFNNLADSHNETGVSLGGKLVNQNLVVNGLTYVDPFIATTTSSTGYKGGVNLADNPTLLPGRSIVLSLIFGFSPRR
jgi:iron complex outermembrane recepter protein